MGRHFPVREKSGNFEQTEKVREKSGKITQNTGKLREFQTNIIFYFLVIFKLTVYYFVEMHKIFSYKINFQKNTGKMEKILEKSGNFVSPEKWEPWHVILKFPTMFISKERRHFYSTG